MKIIQLLLEYNREATLNNWGKKLSQANEKDSQKLSEEEILNKIESVDPSVNKQFVQWIVRQYVSGVLKIEDLYKVTQPLIIFQQYKRRLPQEKRDINKLSLVDLYNIEDSISNASLQEPSENEDFGPDVKVLYNGPLGWLAIPQTEEASCRLGRGTKWCTAATGSYNRFELYSGIGDLYIWKDKNGKKYQFWYPTEIDADVEDVYDDLTWAEVQIMDDKDKPISKEIFKQFESHPILKKIIKTCEEKLVEYIPLIVGYCTAFKGRWPELEQLLIQSNDSWLLGEYACNVIKGRWKEAEPVIALNDTYWKKYVSMLGEQDIAAINSTY